jgi:ankyrin repeat protein
MWVILVVEILNKEYDGGRIHKLRQRLGVIPEDLNQLFRDILTRDNYHRDELLLCIQWLLFSRQPLRPEELYFAVLSGSGPESVGSWNVDEISMDDIKKFILSCSKGLAEITKSKNPTVQFIHESVKDFLLKEKGLKEIYGDFGEGFERKSHNRLKQLCLEHIDRNLKKFEIPEPLPNANSDYAKELRQRLQKEFPILSYAVQNVLYHANAAEMDQSEQDLFFQIFNLDFWSILNNVFERFQRSWLDRRVTQLYVLAMHNAGNLIRRHPSRSFCLETEKSRYGLPLLAALATNSYDAVAAFLEVHAQAALSENHPNACVLHQLYKEYLRDSDKRKWDSKGILFSQRKNLLSYLAEYGDVTVTSFWLNFTNVDVNAADDLGDTALTMAAGKGNNDVLNLLLRHHADVKETNAQRESPLHRAAFSGHESTLIILLESGADISTKDNAGRSPLHCAVDKGHAAAVKALIKAGADIEHTSIYGESLLFLAVSNGDAQIVNLLLNAGAELEVKNGAGVPLLWAAARKRNRAIFEMLLDAGADAKATGSKGESLLYNAVENGYAEIVEVLLKAAGDINVKGETGKSLLYCAAEKGYAETVEVLLKTGANIHLKRENGESLLHIAAERGLGSVVKVLLNAGAKQLEERRPHRCERVAT